MQQVKKYQRFAALCLEQARATTDHRLKAFLAEMAQEWQRLVEDVKGQKVKQDFRSPPKIPETDGVETQKQTEDVPSFSCSENSYWEALNSRRGGLRRPCEPFLF